MKGCDLTKQGTKQGGLFAHETQKGLMRVKQAAIWAAGYTKRDISEAHISYLIQYGRIKKYGTHTQRLVDAGELKSYYDGLDTEQSWKEKLGADLNWQLSFAEYREKERTKHVHRLHPYKGKFIPQLVEYFMDAHVDDFKTKSYFQKGDIVLDPFCGSGTTLVQANELAMHAVGVDVSLFNAMICNVKVGRHDLEAVRAALQDITDKLAQAHHNREVQAFDREVSAALARFNATHFPAPDYRREVNLGEIDEAQYGHEKEQAAGEMYAACHVRHNVKIVQDTLEGDGFLGQWLLAPIRREVDFILGEIERIEDREVRKILAVILSRTVRSCRATTHADLGTLKEPVTSVYYCRKHGKICKPIFTLAGWWKRYAADSVKRLAEFDGLRTQTWQSCLHGDSRHVDIITEMRKINAGLADKISADKIKGIFSSPPYVGVIDYHEQHAYGYELFGELFGFERADELEIGPLFKGQGVRAQTSYVTGIAEVLQHSRNYLQQDYDIFLVANDKYDLYPKIAKQAGMKITQSFKRPVLNRVEKDRTHAYAETVFHLQDMSA